MTSKWQNQIVIGISLIRICNFEINIYGYIHCWSIKINNIWWKSKLLPNYVITELKLINYRKTAKQDRNG